VEALVPAGPGSNRWLGGTAEGRALPKTVPVRGVGRICGFAARRKKAPFQNLIPLRVELDGHGFYRSGWTRYAG
jgi:hypothetical protein